MNGERPQPGIVDRAVREADPLDGGLDGHGIDAGLASVWAQLRAARDAGEAEGAGTATTRLARRTRARRSAMLAGVMSVVVAGTAAAAAHLATHTGQLASGPDQVPAGGGDLLAMDGTDYERVLDRLVADIRFAPGDEAARQRLLTEGSLAPQADAWVTTGTARAVVAQKAVCSWADHWAEVRAQGDATSTATAVAAVRTLAGSSAVRDADPAPSPTGRRGDEGTAPTRFGWLPGVLDGMQQGRPADVRVTLTDAGSCAPEDLPHLDRVADR